MNKIRILVNAILGVLIKCFYKCYGIKNLPNIGKLPNIIEKERVIISLTSYGRRVKATLPYALVSLLRQTYRPDAIIVWLDKDEWNDNSLPPIIKQLQTKGISIKYCDNLKSFKKLIPAINEYPTDLIVTFDDDLFYNKSTLKELIDAHRAHPNSIVASRAHKMKFDDSGHILSYDEWIHDIDNALGDYLLPLGGEGVVYKSTLLHSDVCNADLFMSLAPNADDVWFYFMSYLLGTPKYVINNNGKHSIPVDLFYQYFNRKSALMWRNCGEGQNDKQIESIMNYYRLDKIYN